MSHHTSDDHLTDEADLEVRSTGEHDPIVDPEANLHPGDVGSADSPDSIDEDGDDDQEQRRAMLDEVQDERRD